MALPTIARGLLSRLALTAAPTSSTLGRLHSLTSSLASEQGPLHQHLRQLWASSASFSPAQTLPSAVNPSIVVAAPPTAPVTPHPPTAAHGPLTVQYPGKADYFSDREAVILGLDAQPRGIQLLPGQVFNVPVRLDVLHRVVRWLRAMWRQGTHKAKRRGEVKGGGRKPWPQKGTGRARHGSNRSPLWKGGGVAHGPRPRSHAHKLPVALQLLGYKCALSAKANEGNLVLVKTLAFGSTQQPDGRSVVKTATANAHLKPLVRPMLTFSTRPRPTTFINPAGVEVQRVKEVCSGTALLVDCGDQSPDGGQALRQGARNLPWVSIMGWQDVTVYHILKHKVLIMTEAAAKAMAQRLQQPLPQHAARPVRAAWWEGHKRSYEQALQQLLAAQHQPQQPQGLLQRASQSTASSSSSGSGS